MVVANGNNIAMEPTLTRALEVVFGQAEPSQPTTNEGSPTPGVSPTPQPGETPEPTASPQPTQNLPSDIDALIQQANDSFNRAQQLLRDGDFAGYGQEIAHLRQLLQRLAQLSGQ